MKAPSKTCSWKIGKPLAFFKAKSPALFRPLQEVVIVISKFYLQMGLFWIATKKPEETKQGATHLDGEDDGDLIRVTGSP